MRTLDMRDVAIINAMPKYDCKGEVLNVGCGECRIDWHLKKMGYDVISTDVEEKRTWKEHKAYLNLHLADVFDIRSFPVPSREIVLCSQVLEHLERFKFALLNLLHLAEYRLIITVPFEKSFNTPGPSPIGHVNYWSDTKYGVFRDIHEFQQLCAPFYTSISKIRTKHQDIKRNKAVYLLIIDKTHRYSS